MPKQSNEYVYFIFHTDPPPRFPNIGYVGSTYNIFKGNPHSTTRLDPGFTLRNLNQFCYLNNLTTADGRYSIPDNTQATSSSTCTFDFSSETTDSISSYYNSLKVDVSADFSGWGASFSASADYKEVHENSVSHKYRYVSSHATCEVYIASVEINAASLNPAFKEAVQNLPSEITTLVDYMDFIQHWGTHAVTSLTMGGRYGVQSSITNNDYTNMVSTGLDIKAAAEYSGIVSLNANATTSSQKEQAEQFESYRTDYQIYQIGGKPPLNETTSTFEWAQTVKNNPLPLLYTLLPLTDYLTSQYFPNDKNIAIKQSNLYKATTEYCQSLELPDIDFCVNNGPTATPKIEVTFENTFTKVQCSTSVYQIYAPILHNPDYRILGTVVKLHDEDSAIVIVNGKNPPNELIRNAKGWNKVYSDLYEHNSAFRPICDDGFSSVSDIYCCSNNTDCLKDLPSTLPCIALQCLTDCGFQMLGGDLFGIPFGNGVMGNNPLYYSYNFNRFVENWENPSKEQCKCLNFNCLTFI